MSIKNLKPSSNSHFQQGYYTPVNINKYIGNANSIIYRSSWEFQFMKKCDHQESVIAWSSEPVAIPYFCYWDGQFHTYWPDFYMKNQKQDNTIEEFLIEIKPSYQLQKPEKPQKNSRKALERYRYLAKQYIMNRDKYKYAKQFAAERGWRFVVMTEQSFK